MTPEEQTRFLKVAQSREEWRLIYWYSIVALQTTAGPGEMRNLRLRDIVLRNAVIHIRAAAAKNKRRIRTIPLMTPDVAWALDRLKARARDLGARLPSHYLFPMRVGSEKVEGVEGFECIYDPTQPMSDSGIKRAWNEVRAAACMPWLRTYDLRHTGITRLAEAGAPIPVILAMAGHMTLRMQQHYTAVSMMAKRNWMETAWARSTAIAETTGKGFNMYEKKPAEIINWPVRMTASEVYREEGTEQDFETRENQTG